MNSRVTIIALAAVSAAALASLTASGQTVHTAGLLTDAQVPAKVDNFRLVDQKSKSHELYYYKNSAAVVIISQANGAAYSKAAAPAIKALKDKYGPQNVTFLLLDPATSDNRNSIAAEMQKIGLDLPVMMDDTQLIGEGLGVSRTAEAFVIQPKNWRVAYHGPINDLLSGKSPKTGKAKAEYVANALDAMLGGQTVAVSTVKLDSPTLAFPERGRQSQFANISYSKTVAPLLQKNCVACHSQGGIAPFAMDSYEKVKGFAPMMREALRTDRMPPYNADPHVSQFRDGNMNLSPADTQTLVHWIEAGAPRGDGEDVLKVNARPAPEWELGTPDMILEVPPFKIPASGVVDYQRPVLTVPVTETRWIRAVTFNVGQRQGLHHIVSAVGDYAVGAETAKYPEGQGVEVKPGQKVALSVHYTPFGKEVTDTTRIGLYFYPKDQPPGIVRRTAVIANPTIEIPPGEARHKEVAYMAFPSDTTLYSVFPHAHYRGENAQVFVQKPGQKEELVVSLPKYDFNWQRGYYFTQPIDLPAGSKVITRYEYDNSANNVANPDPTKTITWGEQSWEEMQYTELSISFKGETAANQKPALMMELNNSRAMGLLDTNVDGKIDKTELHGRMGQMVLANFDKLDVDKDGFITAAEAAGLTPLLNRRVAAAEDSLATGAPVAKPK